jgi:hypothetical protein
VNGPPHDHGGGGGDGNNEDGDGGAPKLATNIWLLALAAAAVLGLFKVGSTKLKLRKEEGPAWLEGAEWPRQEQLTSQSRQWLAQRREWLQQQLGHLQDHGWPQAGEVKQQLQQRASWLQGRLKEPFAREAQPATARCALLPPTRLLCTTGCLRS